MCLLGPEIIRHYVIPDWGWVSGQSRPLFHPPDELAPLLTDSGFDDVELFRESYMSYGTNVDLIIGDAYVLQVRAIRAS
ncbi:hypothetical protein [Sinorhizobium meliloti]|uniref:hypothetical protein n=1 Tax=Rhizobium meliloti TaxID=382 RepID=UPI000FDB8A84|nr:hypothetical protein [Sinorhizobium meliloti]RVK17010.1 hypothetical protein CN164_03645 [Sinorhizobium meliloti]